MKRLLMFCTMSAMMLHAEGGVLDVQWPAVDKNQAKMQKAYPLVLKEKIKEVTLPVYLPSTYIYNQKMTIVAEPNYYSITIYLDKARLLVTGDRTYQQSVKVADQAFKTMMKSDTIAFEAAEGMLITDFNRHGVNYTLMLECDEPESDERCQEENFLRTIYDQLTLVGGKR